MNAEYNINIRTSEETKALQLNILIINIYSNVSIKRLKTSDDPYIGR